MDVVKVFVNEKGEFGNPVGIVLDLDKRIPQAKRQRMALDSGFSEIVFINDLDKKSISIFSPQREIPFAGHAAVGAAYHINNKHKLAIGGLMGMKGKIKVFVDNDKTWVKGDIGIAPNWNYEQLDSPNEVDGLIVKDMREKKHVFVWSWLDQKKGVVRARTFADDWSIPEDEANGSGSMLLAHKLNRELVIHHGKGSVIYTKPCDSQAVYVGGFCKLA